MAAETGFIIDGTRHPVPTLDTFTMDEAQVLYDYCGLTIEDFVPLETEDDEAQAELGEKLKNPGFLRALMHVAYQRANPRMSTGRVTAAIGAADLVENFDAYLENGIPEDADAVPPESTTEPENSSPTSSVSSNGTSGNSSTNGSDEPEDQDATTGTTGSATSSLAATAATPAS